MEIKNQTAIIGEELNLMTQPKFIKINPAVCIVSIVFWSMVTLALMIMNFGFEWENVKFIYIILSAVALGLSIGLYIVSKGLLSAKMNSNFCDGIRYSYVFKDDCFDVDAELSGQSSHSTISYSSLYDIRDKDSYVMIFISKVQFYLCKYDGFQPNERDECLSRLFLYQRKKK